MPPKKAKKAAAPKAEGDWRERARAARAKRPKVKRMTAKEARDQIAGLREYFANSGIPQQMPNWTPLTPAQQEQRRREMEEWHNMHN